MRRTLKDMARHLKNVITPEIPETYTINPMFRDISNEENIREGVLAFRNFLYKLCDILIAEGDSYDNHKKIIHAFDDRVSISVYYPFLHNVKCLLLSIGFNSVLSENAQSLDVGNNIFNTKISVTKNIRSLRFLTDCGILIDGIDLKQKKHDLSKFERIKISYPDNPAMLTGLKVMAIAEREFGTKANKFKAISYCRFSDILLRCDYRVLKNNETDVISILKDTIKPLSVNVQDFILQLHQRYLDKGLKCNVEIKDLWIKIKYSCKRNEIWGINASLNNGYQINIKAKNTHKYVDAIEKFPSFLQEMIEKGYGCGKKRGISDSCDGGCRGFRISLDDSIIDISNAIETWFDKELLFV
ncbi:hypothetical protein [Sporosalibacterium faouarense]|uniref:hypothetical protein n=1 Tax=Sporosalibacterium faouarense TaxID=516123 RepID=UPI00192CD84E|nr:hypothetical protein [Sporosalibacterium faouarense]